MDAWETLISYSGAPPGSDAWTCLNSITGGGGIVGTVYIQQLGVDLMADPVEVEMNNLAIEVEAPGDSTELEVVTETIELEVQ